MTGKSSSQATDTNRSAVLRAEELASPLPPLLAQAERVAQSLAHGAHGRRRSGPGEAFWQYRRAGPGDGLAAIDWRRSGRSDHLFVRETEWAASQTIRLWVDASPSMHWRSDVSLPLKHDCARLLILALAALLLQGGERVAPLAGAAPAFWGAGALGRLAAAMERAGNVPPAAPPDLPRHASLALAGDFLDPWEEIRPRLDALAAAGAAGHLVQVLDPAEEEMPYAGRVRFAGLEGEEETESARAEDLRDGYLRRLAEHRDHLSQWARAHGWSLLFHRTDHSPAHALAALAQRVGTW